MKIKNIVLILIVVCSINNISAEFVNITIYDDSISTQSETLFEIINLTNNTVIVAYNNQQQSLRTRIGTIYNNSITWSNESIVSGSSYGGHIVDIAKINDSNFIIVYSTGVYGSDIASQIGTINNNNISYSSEFVLTTVEYHTDYISIAMLTDEKFVISANTKDICSCTIGYISGNTIIYGASYSLNQDMRYLSVSKINSTYFILSYSDVNNLEVGTSIIGSVIGNIISFSSEYIFNNGASIYITSDIFKNNKILINYVDQGNSNKLTSIIATFDNSSIIFGNEFDFGVDSLTGNMDVVNDSSFIVMYINSSTLYFVHGFINNDCITYDTPIIGESFIYSLLFPKMVSINQYCYVGTYIKWGPYILDGVSILWDSTPNIIYDNPNCGFGINTSWGNCLISKETSIIHLSDNVVIATYCSHNREDYVVSGIINDNITIWGNPVQIAYTYSSTNAIRVHKINENKFVLIFKKAGGGPGYNSEIRVQIGNVINNVIIMSSSIIIEPYGAWGAYLDIDVLNDYCIISYAREYENTKVMVGMIEDNDIHFGSPVIINNDVSTSVNVRFLDDSRFIVYYNNGGSGNFGNSVIGNYLGNIVYNISSEYTFSNNAVSSIDSCILNSNKIIISYYESGIKCIIGNIIGNTIIYSDKYLLSIGTYPAMDIYNTTNFRLTFIENNDLHTISGYINNNDINFDNNVTVYNGTLEIYSPNINIISDNKYIITYIERVYGDGGSGNSIVWDCTSDTSIPIIEPDSTHTNHSITFDGLFDNLTVWSFLTVIFGTFEAQCGGDLFWLIIIMIPFSITWIKQKSVIIPSTLALLCGGVLFSLVPVAAIAPIKILLTVGVAGIFYHIIKSR